MSNSTPHIQLQKGNIHMLILGGSNGGNALLNLFYHYSDWLYIDGVIDEQAVAIQHGGIQGDLGNENVTIAPPLRLAILICPP